MKIENMERIASLVARAKAMDGAAWDDLYSETVRQIYFVVKKTIANQQDAEDLVQDTYITAFRNLNQLNEPGKFRAWLSMIAANKCKDYLKKNRPVMFTDLQNEEDDGDIQWEDEDQTWQPDVVLDEKETTRLVAEIISSLPEDQRLCVMLYYREELSVGEIADSLGVSTGTVKSRLNYARAKIKAQVLELEKKGTKLYGLAPIPFLVWLLKAEMSALEIPAAISTASATAAATTVTAASTVTASATSTATATTVTSAVAMKATAAAPAAVAVKTGLFTALGTKIAAGVLAGIVGISGTAGIIATVIRNHENNTDDTGIEEQIADDNGVISNIADDEDVLEVPGEVAAAYDTILAGGVTKYGTKITHYAYIDLGDDGNPELVVADGAGSADTTTNVELYAYGNGEILFCGKSRSENDVLYIANGTHLMARHPAGNQLMNREEFTVAHQFLLDTFEQGNGLGFFTEIHGELIGYAEENYNDYNAMPWEEANIPMIKSVEPIEMMENKISVTLLQDIIDFDKAWCWKEEYSQGSAHSYLVYAFAFKDDGSMVYTVAIEYSDVLGAYYGTYTEANGCITMEIDWRNGEIGTFTFEVAETANGFSLTQVSDEGIFDTHEKGQVLNLAEETNNDAERHFWFTEVMSDPDYEEWY